MAARRFPEEAVSIATKFGFLTKEIWKEYLYSNRSVRMQNWSWANLVKKGLFLPHPNKRLMNVYVLNRRSPCIQARVGDLSLRPPHEGQIRHDEILMKGLLEIEKAQLLEYWMSEGELKCLGYDSFQIASQGQLIKYPDAIFYLNPRQSKREVAVELELSLKSKRRYRQILSAYSFMRGLSMILFVVETPVIEKAIREAVNETYFSEEGMKIGFMRASGWRKNPTKAEVDLGDQRASFEYLIISPEILKAS